MVNNEVTKKHCLLPPTYRRWKKNYYNKKLAALRLPGRNLCGVVTQTLEAKWQRAAAENRHDAAFQCGAGTFCFKIREFRRIEYKGSDSKFPCTANPPLWQIETLTSSVQCEPLFSYETRVWKIRPWYVIKRALVSADELVFQFD